MIDCLQIRLKEYDLSLFAKTKEIGILIAFFSSPTNALKRTSFNIIVGEFNVLLKRRTLKHFQWHWVENLPFVWKIK